MSCPCIGSRYRRHDRQERHASHAFSELSEHARCLHGMAAEHAGMASAVASQGARVSDYRQQSGSPGQCASTTVQDHEAVIRSNRDLVPEGPKRERTIEALDEDAGGSRTRTTFAFFLLVWSWKGRRCARTAARLQVFLLPGSPASAGLNSAERQSPIVLGLSTYRLVYQLSIMDSIQQLAEHNFLSHEVVVSLPTDLGTAAAQPRRA